MNTVYGVQLQIVNIESVLPHEVADPSRERRISERLQADQVLRDPIVVGALPDLDSYVLLDGTNRRRALQGMGIRHVLVQVIDYSDHHVVELRTWCHLASIAASRLVERAAGIGGIEISPLLPLEAGEALGAASTLAVLLDRNERYVISRAPDHTRSRPQQLRELIDLYEAGLTRIDCDHEEVEEEARTTCVDDLSDNVLVAFPAFARSQVVACATGGALIPAGITRHVILQGRALRVNFPLDVLRLIESVEEAQAALAAHGQGMQPRLYREPTILFDS